MGGRGESAKEFFQKNTNIASKKCWEQNQTKKEQNHVLYIHTKIVTKKWGKTRETIFPETHE